MRYNINNKNLPKVLCAIEKYIQESTVVIDELLETDKEYSTMKIIPKMFIKILDALKLEVLDIKESNKILIKYNGNPYITLNLCILAIITKNEIILDGNQNMYATNKYIVKIVNETLSEFDTDNLIELKDDIAEDKNDFDQIICIDNIYLYNKYLRAGNSNVKFYGFEYIDFYTDTDEYDDIQELIYKYADENQIAIESYSELGAAEAIKMLEQGLGKKVVVLTDNERTKEEFKAKIKNKKLYINKNPFDNKLNLIEKEILYI